MLKKLLYLEKKHLETIAFAFYTVLLSIPLTLLRLQKYKLARIKSGRVGHLISETFSIVNDTLLKESKVIFLLRKNDISNEAYINMYRLKYKNIFIKLPSIIHRSLRLPTIFMIDVDEYHTNSETPVKSFSIIGKSPKFFTKSDLPKNSISEYKKFVANYNIKKDQKIVILHFRSHQSNLSDENQHYTRNVNANSYSKMIDFLCNKGFIVIRIGDPNVFVKVKHKKNFIDYGNSEIKSSYLDLALCANCNFFIGSSSGALWLSAIFNRPILGLNLSMPFIFSPTGKCNEIGVPKLIRNKKTKQVLSLKEIYECDVYKVRSAEDDLMKTFEVIENNENDMIIAVEEMIDFIKNPYANENKYNETNNLIRSLNKKFEVDAESLSKFSLKFLEKYRHTLLKKL